MKAVVLAAGRGARMQRGATPAALDPDQRRAADAGKKALVPFHGHAFLAHGLSALAEAGVREACLVVGPGPDPIRAHFERVRTQRISLEFAVQERPTGSAHALLAAAGFAGHHPVLVVNADNLYPPEVVREVAALEGNGLAGFRASALAARGNIPAERIAAFALLEVDEGGCLVDIVEKPGAARLERFGPDPLVSMTLWRFTPRVFELCRALEPSVRGEYELPDAVRGLIDECVRVVPVEAGVLDLTSRGDIPRVEARLRGSEVRL